MTKLPVQPPLPTQVNYKCSHKAPKRSTDDRVAVILPDMQVGFRLYENGKLDPFHDEKAIRIALQVLEDTKPDLVVLLGDNLDLPDLTLKYAIQPEFQRTTQASIDYLYTLLAKIRGICGNKTEIVFLAGNHDFRLEKLLVENAKSLLGLKRAEPTPEDWPVLSVPYLLRLDELDVTYVDGYPANRHYISGKLQAVHGTKVRSNGSTAKAVVNDLDGVSTIFGHVHRQEQSFRTLHTPKGPVTLMAASPGCLCRIDGAVPSVKGGTVNGRPVLAYENWQQGLAVVDYSQRSGEFDYSPILIRQTTKAYRARFNGRLYES